MIPALYESSIKSLPLLGRGKVRDIYAVGSDKLLIVASDRLSAFDVVLPDPIPDKGKVLTQLADFWFGRFSTMLPNQLTGIDPASVVAVDERDQIRGRALVVKRLVPLPIEAVVRGYLIGSGWKDYQETGAVCGIRLPAGLELAARLPEPIFTPATKEAIGNHDVNVSFDEARRHCESALAGALRNTQKTGARLAEEAREAALALYAAGAEYALTRGIIVADTKFEFGVDDAGVLHLIDEALTPDSSRFWPSDAYRTGVNPPSFDKQYVRDFLETRDWDKTPPAPALPAEVILKTSEKYKEAYTRLSGRTLAV
ncbi:MAG: phosphoribosylaminoimidazolesuccinocarboxamide synthase [Candidatus Accumulibacter sp.]|jgi:phosphoribosylaminoimidazole-succinocarboxamide synthase|nr:phosphoribosylaminoimidazolesuccinocarboxamide synthase [Accumulibacter sp.]